jgi:hypothetical protein
MKALLATVLLASAMLALAPSEASAWVCRADGFGSSGRGQSRYVEYAKYLALRRCEYRAAFHICTIRYCRP